MIKNLVLGNLTTVVAGMLMDQSLANKFGGRFGANGDPMYIAGTAYKDPSNPTLVFQKYRANYDFSDYNNIAGLVLANNATVQPLEFSTDTPSAVIVPIKSKTQFSVLPYNQLFQVGYWVRQGEASGVVRNGQVLYKKIPTALDTGVDLSIHYAFNKNTTQDLTNFVEIGVEIAQANCYSNCDPLLYPNATLVIGTTYNVRVQSYAGAGIEAIQEPVVVTTEPAVKNKNKNNEGENA